MRRAAGAVDRGARRDAARAHRGPELVGGLVRLRRAARDHAGDDGLVAAQGRPAGRRVRGGERGDAAGGRLVRHLDLGHGRGRADGLGQRRVRRVAVSLHLRADRTASPALRSVVSDCQWRPLHWCCGRDRVRTIGLGEGGRMTRRAWLLFAAMGVIWGIPYLMIKVVVDAGVSPGFLVFARTAIGAVLLLPVAIHQGAVRPALAQWRPVLAFAAIELGFTWYLLNSAEEKLNSSVVALLIAMVPLIGTLIAWRLGDRSVLRPGRLGGLAIGLGGVGVVVGANLTSGGT